MEVNHATFSRAVDWRLRTAQAAADSGQYLSPDAFDEITRRAADFLSRRRRLAENDRSLRLRSFSNVRSAIETYERGGRFGAELDARLLTDQSLASIGEVLGIPRDAIACYAVLCFDVKWRLDQTGFIDNQVIASDFAAGRHLAGFFKLAAYYVGQEALELFLGRGQSRNIDELVKNIAGRGHLLLKLHAGQMMADLKIDDRMSASRVLHGVTAVQREEAFVGSDSNLQDNLHAFWVSLGEHFQTVDVKTVPEEGVDAWAAELRPDQLGRESIGMLSAAERELLASLKYPEPDIETNAS